jgi:hypothetical protein
VVHEWALHPQTWWSAGRHRPPGAGAAGSFSDQTGVGIGRSSPPFRAATGVHHRWRPVRAESHLAQRRRICRDQLVAWRYLRCHVTSDAAGSRSALVFHNRRSRRSRPIRDALEVGGRTHRITEQLAKQLPARTQVLESERGLVTGTDREETPLRGIGSASLPSARAQRRSRARPPISAIPQRIC